ncbi:467_t:CDS:2, partial [Acaulospora morrowiae]
MNGDFFSPSLWFNENPKYTKENAPDAIFLMMGKADSGLVKLLEKAKQTSDLEIRRSGMIDIPGSNPPFCHYIRRGPIELRVTFTVFTGYQPDAHYRHYFNAPNVKRIVYFFDINVDRLKTYVTDTEKVEKIAKGEFPPLEPKLKTCYDNMMDTRRAFQSVTTVIKRLHPKVPYIVVVTNRDKLPEFSDTLIHKYLELESLSCPIEIVDTDMDHMDDVIEWSNQLMDMNEWCFLNRRLS